MLHPGDPFPALTLKLPGGGSLQLPDALAGGFGVVLFNRGSWCPYCNAQLRAFHRSLDSLTSVDAKIVALSVDDEAATEDLIAKHGLQFPVGHSADPRAIADATGHRASSWRRDVRSGPGTVGAGVVYTLTALHPAFCLLPMGRTHHIGASAGRPAEGQDCSPQYAFAPVTGTGG